MMIGRLDVATNEWTDGIFSKIWRENCKQPLNKNVWIVLDGPIDTLWIENLNSVLDDNKTLTLANSDRIVMSPNVRLVFEIDNLENASPATVSRAGMVYINENCLGCVPLWTTWLEGRSKKERDVLLPLFQNLWEEMLIFVHDTLIRHMHISSTHELTTCLQILAAILPTESVQVAQGQIYIEVCYNILQGIHGCSVLRCLRSCGVLEESWTTMQDISSTIG